MISWEGWSLSFLVDGELESRTKSTAMAFGRLPEGRRLGHAPPPPRPLGRFGGIVAVDADRFVRGFKALIQVNGRVHLTALDN
jgi:hypothetical protein